MPKHPSNGSSMPRLAKWRFKEPKSGDEGIVKLWWSDGSKTEEAATYLDAIARLKNIQDNGGLVSNKKSDKRSHSSSHPPT